MHDAVATAPIRDPVLRGHQSVAGLWFPAEWFDEATRAARLISCWRQGASALRFPQGDLLCYATPIEESCEDLPGWSLRQEGNALCSAALSSAERMAIREGDVWIVVGAEVLTLRKRDGMPLDPSEWLAIDQLSLHDTYDCSVAPPPPVVLDLESRPLREILGNAVPPASREQADFLAAMRRAQREHPERGLPTRSAPANGGGSRILIGVLIAIAVVVAVALIAASGPTLQFPWLLLGIVLIRLMFGGFWKSGGTTAAGTGSGGAAAKHARPSGGLPPRSPLAHPQRWRRWLAQIAATSRLARLVGAAQARHLRRVLGLFDEGKLEEALRHAIPLDGNRGSLGQAFGTPGRRANLDLTRVHGPSTSIQLGDDLQDHLRTLYRQAFAKLDREKRFDEAVFVLAELLNAKREALDYLEKHERFAQAAELALGWDMPPEIIVRLHCLAGDWRRAVAVARRDNAFGSAVLQLESRWPDAARRLREEWGNTLVQQGDWLGAVNAVWPAESLREKATQWLLTAESAGGRLASRALVQRAILLPDTLDRYAKELLELQRDRSLWSDRQAMAEALLSIGRNPAAQQLAALIAPAVLADHAEGHRRFDSRTLRQFVQSAGDVLLQVDLPNNDWPGAQPVPASSRTEVLCFDGPEAGAHRILDAVPLDDQCSLLALGESGACVVDASGRVRARFAAPAQRIVIAYSRQVALLLARRESLWRVSRLDLAQRTIVDLGVIAFDFCATEFDGLSWTIAQGRHLRVLDTQSSLQQVVWQVTDLPGDVCGLTTSTVLEQIVLRADQELLLQLWMYRLPQRRLTARDDVTHVDGQIPFLNPTGGIVRVAVEPAADEQICLRWHMGKNSTEIRLRTTIPEELQIWVAGDWLVACTRDESGYLLRWLLLGTGAECVQVRWPADTPPNVRPCGDEWLLFDGQGRLMSFSASNSQRRSFSLR